MLVGLFLLMPYEEERLCHLLTTKWGCVSSVSNRQSSNPKKGWSAKQGRWILP